MLKQEENANHNATNQSMGATHTQAHEHKICTPEHSCAHMHDLFNPISTSKQCKAHQTEHGSPRQGNEILSRWHHLSIK